MIVWEKKPEPKSKSGQKNENSRMEILQFRDENTRRRGRKQKQANKSSPRQYAPGKHFPWEEEPPKVKLTRKFKPQGNNTD